jgi:cobalt-precorrin-5B (C1)-methyltransferase
VELLEPAETAIIPIDHMAGLSPNSALAITHSDPGDNLDLTRNTPLWAMVEWLTEPQETAIVIAAGEGIGRLSNSQPAIYRYAQRLLQENLQQWLPPGRAIRVTLILPEGRSLARRTSNEAFGVVAGLSLLGTSGIAQPLSAPGQLEQFQHQLRQQLDQWDELVFCIGENGLDLARRMGIPSTRLVKTANWLGSLLVEAGMRQAKSILLFGYHGKLIKLAGSIFHTHHYVADGRMEILTAHCAAAGLTTKSLQEIFAKATVEDGLQYLHQLDAATGSDWVNQVYGAIAQRIDDRTQAYIHAHCDRQVMIGSVLFDRRRQIITSSSTGISLLNRLIHSSDSPGVGTITD